MIHQTNTVIDGRYRVLGVLGQGGMGGVFAAHDERLGRRVALKMLRPDLAADAHARERFLREARIAAGVRHPNVVRTFDVGDAPEGPYLIQELLEGRSLGVEQLPPRRTLAIVRDIAQALRAIHEQGFVHCDVKPANVMLVDGETRAVLLDFGIARDAGDASTSLIATPQYLAPERAFGAAPSASSDLYSLGIVLYVLLSGTPPFSGPDIHTLLLQHRDQPLPPLVLADPAARALAAIAARLAAKQPHERYASAAALLDDLQQVEHGAMDAVPTLPVSPPAVAAAVAAPRTAAVVDPGAAPATGSAGQVARVWWLLPLLLLLLGGMAFMRPDTGAQDALPLRSVPQAPSAAPSAAPAVTPSPVPPTAPPATAPATVAPPADENPNRGRGNGRDNNRGKDEEDEEDED